MMNNPAIDLIIRIKNGYMAGKDSIVSPHSKFRETILKKLVSLKYVKDYKVEGATIKNFKIELLYTEGAPAMTDVKIYSKGGRRWYAGAKQLKSVLGGMGYSIISTPKGILTNIEARREKVGGELLFEIW